MRTVLIATALTLFASAKLFAQTPPAPKPPAQTAQPPAQPNAQPAAQARAAQPAGTAQDNTPPPPSVQDPMLTPVPPATMVLSNWEDALKYLRARSTDLRIAFQEIRRAEGLTEQALSNALPTLTATATGAHYFTQPPQFVLGTGQDYYGSAGLQFSAPILAVQAWDQVGINKITEDVNKLSLVDTKRTLAIALANAMVAVVTAERVAELNRSGLQKALETLILTKQKQALGAGTALDVVRAQEDVETARATLVTGDESLRQAREALGLAIGYPQQVGVTTNVNFDELRDNALRSCRTLEGIESRADIVAQKKKVEVAERNLRNIYYNFIPTINLQSSVTAYSYEPFPHPSNPSNPTWNIQAVLTFPIYDGGQRYGQIKSDRALHVEAEQTLESLRRQGEIQLAQALRAVMVSEDSRVVAQKARDEAADLDRLTRISYREGTVTSLDLVVSAAGLRQAEINLALQEFNLVKARIGALLTSSECTW